MHLTRGIIAGLIGAVAGVVTPVLVIIFFGSMLIYFLISFFDPSPSSYTYGEDTRTFLSEFLRLFLPPLVIACSLVVSRCFGPKNTPHNTESDGLSKAN